MDFFLPHGIALQIVWFVGGFIMVATARWFSMFWKYNMLIHTIIGNIIMAVTYYYCLRALNKAEFAFEFDKIHNILGYILTIAIGFITGSGAVARY